MLHIAGTGDIIAVMITELRGKDILSYLEKNISVQMTIAVGARMPPKNFSRGSLVFVSISFIVLMIISSAWLIFYFIQKIRYTNARDRNQVSWCAPPWGVGCDWRGAGVFSCCQAFSPSVILMLETYLHEYFKDILNASMGKLLNYRGHVGVC